MTSTTGSMDLITDEAPTAGPLTVGSIVQLTEAQSPPRRWIWRSEPLAEDVLTFGTLPDPRDAYIAEQTARFLQLEQELGNANARVSELEAALSSVRDDLSSWRISFPSHQATMRTIDAALMPEPEASMRETIEELEA